MESAAATAFLPAHRGVLESLGSAAGATALGGCISLALGTNLLHDMFGSLAFLSAVFTSLAASSGGEPAEAAGAATWRPTAGSRQLLASGMVVLWAIRLGSFLSYRAFR